MPVTVKHLFSLAFVTLLAACGPTQQGDSTALAGDQNVQISGVVIEQSPASGGSPAASTGAPAASTAYSAASSPSSTPADQPSDTM